VDDKTPGVAINIARSTPVNSLVGGEGTDTLSVVVQDAVAGATGVAGFFTNGVENINIQVADVAGQVVDFQGVAGATTLTSLNSAGALTVNNVQNNVKTVVQGTNADVTVNYANALVSGSADTAEVEINGVATTSAGNVTIDLDSVGNVLGQGFETVNVKSTGAASGNSTSGTRVVIGDDVANTIKTVNISGDAAARLIATLDGAAANTSTTVGTVNITNTAGVNVVVAGANRTFVSVTGGTGNDTISVTNLDANSTLAGGEGVDTLAITSSDLLLSTAFKNVTGFEKIQFGGSLNQNQNLTSAGNVTDVILSGGAAGGTVSGVASGLNLQFTAGATTSTVALNNAATSTTDVLNVTVGNTTTLTNNLNVGTLNIGNIETVNLTSSTKEENN